MIYADTSALGRAYFADEEDHRFLRRRLLEGDEQVVTSALTRVEITSAAHRATAAGRISDGGAILRQFDAHCRRGGPIVRLALRPNVTLPRAVSLAAAHALRSMDALHLAVALTDGLRFAGAEELRFVTRDAEQAAAARALGFTLD